jgi:hypothetical protein
MAAFMLTRLKFQGQYEMVLNLERSRIQNAFKSFENYSPKLTMVICTKRHHTRFFDRKNNTFENTPPGTVVDQGITSITGFDYYLQAHACIKGTARSTHYTTLYDENKYTADEIQTGTNALSYLWARATKSVSLVPPAYWADKACERGRCYLREIFLASPDEVKNWDKLSEDEVWEKARMAWGEGVHDNLKDTMFYM